MILERMAISKEIKDRLTSPIPGALIKERKGGGQKMLSYISGSTVIDMLNATFGYMWSWQVTKEWTKDSIDSVNKWKDKKLQADPANWTVEEQGPVAHVKGILTVHLTGENGQIIEIKKEGFGSKSILGKQNDQESIFKAAGTDALKKAASLLGIGLELYRDEDEQAYFNEVSYEDPWTDEMRLLHATNLENLGKYTSMYAVSDEELANMVLSATGTDYDIVPDNIEAVMAYIEESLTIKEE